MFNIYNSVSISPIHFSWYAIILQMLTNNRHLIIFSCNV